MVFFTEKRYDRYCHSCIHLLGWSVFVTNVRQRCKLSLSFFHFAQSSCKIRFSKQRCARIKVIACAPGSEFYYENNQLYKLLKYSVKYFGYSLSSSLLFWSRMLVNSVRTDCGRILFLSGCQLTNVWLTPFIS